MKIVHWIHVSAFVALFAIGCPLKAQETFVEQTPQPRKVLVEEFTGLHCSNCPGGHKMAGEIEELYPEDCFFVNIHAGSLAVPRPGETDLRSAYGEVLASRAGVSGIPSAEISRHAFPGETGLTTSNRGRWLEYVENLLWEENDRAVAAVNIAAQAELDWSRRELKVTVQLYYTASSLQSANYLHVMLVQDNIKGQQDGSAANPAQVLADGSYLHRHVLRDLLTDIAGDRIETTAEGSLVTRTYTKELPETYNQTAVDFLQLQVVAFVTESEKEVLNACRVEPVFSNGPEYVFEMKNFETVQENTCDNGLRFCFDLVNRNPESAKVENVSFLFRTAQGREQEHTVNLTDFSASSTVRVEVPSVQLDAGGVDETVQVQVKAVNGTPLKLLQEAVSVTARKDFYVVNEPEVTLNLWQDRWGTEISWAFTAQDGTVIDKVNAYADLSAAGTEKHVHKLTLPHGCNMFVLRDMAKDGINNISGEGHLEMLDKGGNRVAASDGTYSDSLVWMFRYSPVSVRKFAPVGDLRAYPNPAHDRVVLSFTLARAGSLQYGIRSLDGREQGPVRQFSGTAGTNTLQLPLSGFAPGIYLLWLSTKEGLATVKITVR
ncbi:MAG: Omp28-related outer membrane protein [Bacteroides sp.]|nr:Omp28-related outer membrane protein [Ruminococcus flavefaciens]MCM1554002.1 Omp28-related outer membrane protein [Bacteroides sp.]